MNDQDMDLPYATDVAAERIGRVYAEALLTAAQQEPNRERRRNQVCEANYYLGMSLWTAAKKAEAIPYLEVAARPEYSGNYEYTEAKKILRAAR